MGECFITRRGAENYKLPILNSLYPSDVSVVESVDGIATFNILIDTPGSPAEYTYQWYIDGKAVTGETKSSYTKSGLDTEVTHSIYCTVTNKAGTVFSRTATLKVLSSLPDFDQDLFRDYKLYDEGPANGVNGARNWRMKLKSSGKLIFNRNTPVDIFLVGGGGAGSNGHGGGGGYVKTIRNIILEKGRTYDFEIGSGGTPNETNSDGYPTVFGDYSVSGGCSGYKDGAQKGGDGGSGGGAWGGEALSGNGGSNGKNGGGSWTHKPDTYMYVWYHSPDNHGIGQIQSEDIANTYEFGEERNGKDDPWEFLYAGGGGGGRDANKSSSLNIETDQHRDDPIYREGKPYTWGGYGGAGGGGNGANCSEGTYSLNTAATSGTDYKGGGGGGGDRNYVYPDMKGGCGVIVIRNHREG